MNRYWLKVRSRLKYEPLRSSKDKGVALLLGVTSLILMVYIASEVTKDSTIEYVVNSQEVNRLKAYYAARNGMDIALLRIKIYQQVAGMNLPPNFASELDNLWKFPFSWPLPVLGSMGSGDKDTLENKTKEALFDGQYEHVIIDEGSKIDLNDLASPSKTLRETTTKQILNIFEQQLESDDAFKNEFQNFNFAELVNRMADWLSDTNVSKNGGDKRRAFQELGEDFPPNRGFRTVDEMRLVPGMNETFFNLLAPQVTIYGMKAINPNLVSGKNLKSLDKNLTDEVVTRILERRDDPDKGGAFAGKSPEECRKDFKAFIESQGVRLEPEFDQIPFVCDKVANFKVIATGRSSAGKGAIQKKITAIIMDLSGAANKLKTFLETEKKDAQNSGESATGGGTGATGAGAQSGPKAGALAKEPLPKGRPRIVYWSEI